MLLSLLSSLLISQPTTNFQSANAPTLATPELLPVPTLKDLERANKHTKSGPCSQPVRQSGIASYYSDYYNGRPTASGRLFSNSSNQAAHRSLPFGTQVCVQSGNKQTIVVITDIGPFVAGRIIDLSTSSFQQLAPLSSGLTRVQIHY